MFLAVAAIVHASPVTDAPGESNNPERELRRDIFRDYDSYVRPVKKQTTAVPVKISMTPLSLKSMNEKDQLISLQTWVIMTWKDEYLQWDPTKYGNITLLHVSPSQIWRPDIAVYSASLDTAFFPEVRTKALLYNSGTIMWVPPFTINSRCPIPFHNYVTSARTFVECNIRLGSWTYSGKLLDLQLSTDKVDLTDFEDFNHEWKLVKIVSNREAKFYPCCPEEYPLVHFNITLKKRDYYLNSGSDN